MKRMLLAGLLSFAFLGATVMACKPECSFDTDCPGTNVCLDGVCTRDAAVDLALEGRCEGSSDCALNERCVAGRCEPREEEQNGGPDDPVCAISRSEECGDEVCMPSGDLATCDDPPCDLILDCRPTAGDAAPAHACHENEDCSTNWCRDGVCAAVCLGDATCPRGFSCDRLTEQPPWGEFEGRLRLCVPESDLDVPCDSPAMCPDELTCVYGVPDNAGTRCDEPRGTGVAGELCYLGDCKSGVCMDYGRCTQPCMRSLDCEAGTVCEKIYLHELPGDPMVDACVARSGSCFNPFHCELEDGEVCTIRPLLGREHPTFRCRVEDGAKTGEPCESNSECASSLCTPEGLCGQMCDRDIDCRCVYDETCLGCGPSDDCWLDWQCDTMTYPTSERTYEVRVCRPRPD